MTTEKQKSEFLDRIYKKNNKRISKILNWELPFLNFPNMVSLHTPGDGSCLFHSILKAYNKIAIEEKIGNTPINMSEFIRTNFRKLLSEYLNDTTQYGIEIYKLLNENDFDKNSNSIIELSKDYMINELETSNAVNFDYYCELLIRFCEKNIFVIDYEKQDVIFTGSISDKLRNDDWPCIVLLYIPGRGNGGHYETLGYIDTDGLHTFFTLSNVFIKYIMYRAKLLNEYSKIENIANHIEKVGEQEFYSNVKSFIPNRGTLMETTNETIKTLNSKPEVKEKENKKVKKIIKKESTPSIPKVEKNNSSRSIVEEELYSNSMISRSNRNIVNEIKNSILDD